MKNGIYAYKPNIPLNVDDSESGDLITNKQIRQIYIPPLSGSGLFKFCCMCHKILFTGYLVMANLWILNQIKGNN